MDAVARRFDLFAGIGERLTIGERLWPSEEACVPCLGGLLMMAWTGPIPAACTAVQWRANPCSRVVRTSLKVRAGFGVGKRLVAPADEAGRSVRAGGGDDALGQLPEAHRTLETTEMVCAHS